MGIRIRQLSFLFIEALSAVVDALIELVNAEDSARDLALDAIFDIYALLLNVDSDFRRHTLISEEPARILLDAFKDLSPD